MLLKMSNEMAAMLRVVFTSVRELLKMMALSGRLESKGLDLPIPFCSFYCFISLVVMVPDSKME